MIINYVKIIEFYQNPMRYHLGSVGKTVPLGIINLSFYMTYLTPARMLIKQKWFGPFIRFGDNMHMYACLACLTSLDILNKLCTLHTLTYRC